MSQATFKRFSPSKRLRLPGGGLLVLCLSYGLLAGFGAWALAEPELDKVQALYQTLRIGQQALSPAERNLLQTAFYRHAGLAAALIETNGGELLSPQRNGWFQGPAVLLSAGKAHSLRLQAGPAAIELTARGGSGWEQSLKLNAAQQGRLSLPAVSTGEVVTLTLHPDTASIRLVQAASP